MNDLIKKILLLSFPFLIFSAFSSDVQAEAETTIEELKAGEETTLEETMEKLKAEVLAIRRLNEIFGQVIFKNPEALNEISCVDMKDMVDMVDILDLDISVESVDHIWQECADQCEYIYRRRSDHREQCEKLTVGQIEVLTDIHETLEDPDDDDLMDVFFGYFDQLKIYFDISIFPFDRLIDRYSRAEAREVLFWMMDYPEIVPLVENADTELSVIRKLFQKSVEGFDINTVIYRLFTQKVKYQGDNSFMDSLIYGYIHETYEWFHNYIITESETCSDDKEISIDCFTIFCEMGKDMDKEARKEWIDFEIFKDYINNIILAGINGLASPNANQWNTNDIKGADDVDDFYGELCGNLATADE